MKKSLSLLLGFIVCVAVLAGCGSSPAKNAEKMAEEDIATQESSVADLQLAHLRECIAYEGCEVGIALVAYVDSQITEDDLKLVVQNCIYGVGYPFLTDCPIVMSEGQELYAIVPADENDCITVYSAGITEAGEYEDNKDEVLYQSAPGEPIVLMCNLSEIYSNVLITVGNEDEKEKFEFRPYLSMMDGSVAVQEGCYDFTIYEEQGFSYSYIYDMVGDWWSEPQENDEGYPIYYRIKLDDEENTEDNYFEFSAGDDIFEHSYGNYWPIDSNGNEYGYTMYVQGQERNGQFILTKNGDTLTIKESGGDGLFYLTGNRSANFRFHPYQDLNGEDVSVKIAYEVLRMKDEVLYYSSRYNMELICLNQQQEINGEYCMLFALGTRDNGQFEQNYMYAVSDLGNTYFFDSDTKKWVMLGDG